MNDELQTPEEGTELEEEVTPKDDQEQQTLDNLPVEESPEGEGEGEEAPVQQQQPQADPYKEKFVHSQREGILLNERVKVANSRIEQLTKQDTPTEEAMRQLYPDWDSYNDVTKRAYLQLEASNLRQARTEARQQEIDARLKLDEEVEDILDNPKFSSKLKGREAEFKRFAKKKENRGISGDILAQAFLFEASDDEAPPVEHKPNLNPGLERGNGGPRQAPKPKKLSLEEAGSLRKTNYKEYMRLLKAGMIEDDI